MKKLILLYSLFFVCLLIRGQLQIGAGISWKSSGTTYVVLDDIGLKHDATTSLLDNIFKFTGTGDDTISGVTLPSFSTILLNKTGGKLFLGRSVNANLVNFQTGLFELNYFSLDLGTVGSVSNETEASRFIGASGGYVQIINTLNAPNLSNPGNLGVIITSSQNLGTVTIRRGHQAQTTNGVSGSSILRYFDILPANNSNLDATVRINYFDAEVNGLPENNLAIFKTVDNINWTNLGYTTRDVNLNFVEKTGVSDMARFTLSDIPTAPLPVTGLYLTGKWKNNAAYLDWKTLAEYNNSHFNIERKYANEISFATVGTKNSFYADGNSQSTTFYHWIDAAAGNRGAIEYRLKQVDRDGHWVYSNTIMLLPQNASTFIFRIYPTVAVADRLYIETGNKSLKQMQLQVFDLLGKLCLDKQLDYSSQWISLPKLSAGLYQVKISSGEWNYQASFIKE